MSTNDVQPAAARQMTAEASTMLIDVREDDEWTAGLRVHNVTGGMQAWSQSGLPIVRDDHTAGTVA